LDIIIELVEMYLALLHLQPTTVLIETALAREDLSISIIFKALEAHLIAIIIYSALIFLYDHILWNNYLRDYVPQELCAYELVLVVLDCIIASPSPVADIPLEVVREQELDLLVFIPDVDP
jgi:hypothetical protein